VTDSGVLFFGCEAGRLTDYSFPDLHVGDVALIEISVRTQGLLPLPYGSTLVSGAGLSATVGGFSVAFIRFQPTTPGPFTGTVTVMVDPVSPTGTLTLHANVLPPRADAPLKATIAFSNRADSPTPAYPPVELVNASASTPVNLSSVTTYYDEELPPPDHGVTIPFSATLLKDERMTVPTPQPRGIGCHRIRKHFEADTNAVDVVFERAESFGMSQTLPHVGEIAVIPPDACELGCRVSPTSVMPVAPAGQRFVGWTAQTGCSTEPLCELRAAAGEGFGYWAARFAPATAPAITLTMNGKGRVVFYEDSEYPIICEGNCSYAPSSPSAIVKAVIASPDAFTGWAGDCSGTDSLCHFGIVTADRAITATFGTYDREIPLVAPPAFELSEPNLGAGKTWSRGGAFLPGGDVVVSSGNRLSRISPSSGVVWSQAAQIDDVTTNVAGDFYSTFSTYKYEPLRGAFVTLTRVERRDAGGVLVWSRAYAVPNFDLGISDESKIIALATGNLAILTRGALRVLSGVDGAELWSVAIAGARRLAATSTGAIAVSLTPANGTTVVARFSPSGTRLADLNRADDVVDLAYAANDELILLSSSASGATLTQLRSNGNPRFTHTDATLAPVAMAVAADGEIVVADPTRLQRYSSSGSPTWSVVGRWFGISDLAVDTTGRFLLVGTYTAASGTNFIPAAKRPWATIFTGP